MATCTEVAAFLQQVSAKNVSEHLAPADVTGLTQLGLLQVLSQAELEEMQTEVLTIEQAQAAYAQESAQRSSAASAVGADTRKSHSILFHLSGVDKQHATLERLQQEQSALQSLDEDLVKRQQDFAALLVKKATVDSSCAFDGGFAAITTPGRMALRDLNVRLYRVGAEPFPQYWDESKKVDDQLWGIANLSGQLAVPLGKELPDVDRSYLWAVAIGIAKIGGDPQQRLATFLDAYRTISPLSDNVENRLMASEIVSVLPSSLSESMDRLGSLRSAIGELRVPTESALGVAAILLLGQRADGTFATSPLSAFLTQTPSYESAAMLAIENRPYDELNGKFQYLRSLFGSWGYTLSEDSELSAAYLAISDLPADAISTKLAIIARGLAGYLQYPLVAAAILTSVPVLEANETLNLLEKAYEILGQRTGPMAQAEILCLAVRMIHGIQVASVNEIDPTAKAPPPPTPASFSYVGIAPQLWLPVFIAHNAYYSTFSGIGGAHPGHVHGWGGGGFAGGGVG